MFLNDELKNNKDINYYENSNHPLLRIIYKKKNSKKMVKNDFSSFGEQSNKNKSFNNLILKKITPNKKNKKSKYNSLENNSIEIFSNASNNVEKKYKSKIIDFSSDNSNKSGNINKIEKNPFNIRNKILRANTNKFVFPKLSKKNLIRLKKEINGKNNNLDANLKSNLKINNNNINSNSTFSSEPKSEKYLFLQKLNEDKYHKSFGLEHYINETDNNTYNTGFITSTNVNQITEFQINTEKIDPQEINQSNFNYNNNIFFNYSKIKDDMNKKNLILNKKINFSDYYNSFKREGYDKSFIKKQLSIRTPKNNFFFPIPRKHISNTKYSFNNFNVETINASPIINKDDKIIIEDKSGETNENNNNDKFRYPYRRDRGKRMTQSYNNNFTFFNKLLDRKYEMISNINKDYMNNDTINRNRTMTKHNTILNISQSFNNNLKNNKNVMSLFCNNKNNINIFKKESKTSFYVKDIISSRNESFVSSESESELNNTIYLDKKKSSIHEENKEPSNNEEAKYLEKKRLKLMNQVEELNKSSYLYNSYNEELRNYFLKNCVVDKITDNIFENFEPIESKLETKEDMKINRDKYLKDSFEQIFRKDHKYCHCFEKMFSFVEFMLKQDKIKTELIIRSNHHNILEVFQVYKKLLNQIDFKWNNKIKRKNHYKKMNELFTSVSKRIPNEKGKKNNNFWSHNKDLRIQKEIIIFRERINRENDLSFNDLIHIRSSNKIRKGTEKKSKSNIYNERKFSRYKLRKKTKNSDSKSISGYQNYIITSLGHRSRESTLKIINERKASEDGESINKFSNKLKIKNEFTNNSRTESFEKFAKIYRLSAHSKFRSSKNNTINTNEKTIKNLKKEIILNKTLDTLDNYNILKSSKFFNINKNQLKLKRRYSKLIKLKKDRIQRDKKLRHDTIAIRIAGIDQLSKESALIKTHEIAKDLPEAKLFDKIVKIIQKRKISKFEYIINNEEDKFNNIINKQELSTGNTLLIYATQINLKVIVEILLSKGADPNIKNQFGNTALHMAYKNDNAFIINLLIEYGANDKIKNNKNLLPWQMCKYLN